MMRSIFIGNNGIRAGWRFAMFVAIFGTLAVLAQFTASRILHVNRPVGPIGPWLAVLGGALVLVPMVIAALVMSRVERRNIDDYGLPLRAPFVRRFLIGAAVGFASLSAVLGAIALAGGVQFSVTAWSPALLNACLGYLVTFALVGITEEFLFRGYAQATLAQGMSFWGAAALLSLGFAAAHIGNPGETPMGVAQVAIYGLVFCYVLRVTGNLWFAVGYHMAWDWGETFFYGVPDSGQLGTASFLHGTMLGPAWLSGGADGPEGSIWTTIALLALIPIAHVLYARRARA